MNQIIFAGKEYKCVPAVGRRFPAIFDRARSTIGRIGRAFGERVAEARQRARVYNELAAMSDPELHDIGISRADIPAVVFGTNHRAPYPRSNFTSSNWRVGVLKGSHRVRREGLSQSARIAVLCTILIFVVAIMFGLF